MTNYQTKLNTSKKLFAIIASLTAVNAFAYNATFNNQTPIDIKVVSQSNSQTIKANSSQTLNLDVYTAYSVKYVGSNSDQGLLSIQKNSNTIMQNTPVAPTAGLQNLHVVFQSNSYSGDFYNLYQNGNPSFSGSCANDMGGIACTLAQGDNLTSLNVTVSGGTGPQPVAEYTYDAGTWNSSAIYQVKYSPTLYPKVTYSDGKQYVACWYADSTNTPGAGDPWRVYDASKNVCQ